MRHLTIAVLAFAALSSASAASAADLDYDVLRGADYEPEVVPLIDWSGAYVGGHGGYSNASFGQRNDFSSRLNDYFQTYDIEYSFSPFSLGGLPHNHINSASYGAIIGYNIQFDEIVLGIEADYSHFGPATSAQKAIGPIDITTAGVADSVFLYGKSSTIGDYGSIRARAGYAFENFLPFLTAGVAVGQIAFGETIAVRNSALPAFRDIHSKTVGGGVIGGGIDYAITSNFLLRGEYQYVLLNDLNNHRAEINTVRGAALIKF